MAGAQARDDANGAPRGAAGFDPTRFVARALDVLDGETGLRRDGDGAAAETLAPLELPEVNDLRDQARAWIDRLLELATRQSLSSAAGQGGNGAAASILSDTLGALPVLVMGEATRPGSIARLIMRVVNEGPSGAVKFIGTDLVSASGARVPAQAMNFLPDEAVVPAGGLLPIEIRVAIPPGTQPGSYSALIQGIGQPNARVVLSVRVE